MCQVLLLFILALGVHPGWGFQRLGPLRPRLQLLQQTQPGQARLAVTMGMSLPHMRISSVGEGQSKGKARLMLQYLWRGAVSLGKFLLPIVLPSMVAYLLGVPPAMAAKRKGKRSNSASGAALEAAAAATAGAAGATATVVKKQKRSIFRKILQGVNSADSSSILKGAGDTRGEMAGILNAFSSVFILSGLFFFAFLVHKRREAKMYRAMTAEVSKIREYKENMYFEAVQGILERLADPKLKGSTKANLQKELKALDPDGIIKKFIEDKGERPDISYLIDRKKKAKKDDKFSAIAERPKGKKRPPGGTAASSKSSKSTSPSTEDLDLRDDGDGDGSDGDNEETAAPVPLPAEKAKSPSRPVPRASAEDDGKDDEGASGGRKPPTPTRPPAYLTVLKELSESLEESALSASARKQLLDLLKSKIEAVSDVAKMDAVVSKIAAKLGDIEYWEGYYEKSFS